MKSYGGLWGRITSPENLLAAWGRVRKGHAGSMAVQAYAATLDANLAALRSDLLAGKYQPGDYRQFRVHDPKPRIISCAPVRDRVLHHALCGVITPLLEQSYTEDSASKIWRACSPYSSKKDGAFLRRREARSLRVITGAFHAMLQSRSKGSASGLPNASPASAARMP